MKKIKWLTVALAVACLTAVAVSSSLGDPTPNTQRLNIVQSELQRSADGLSKVQDNRMLLPGVYEELSTTDVTLKDRFSVTTETETDKYTVEVDFSATEKLYDAANALDHIVVVTNTGNVTGYVRTWFAFEMGDLTETEFKNSVLLNKNTSDWDWGEFKYNVKINGENYAVICAEYKHDLEAKATTQPSLLQIMLNNKVTNETAERLDGNDDSKYEIKVFSRAVSDKDAWGAANGMTDPWSN